MTSTEPSPIPSPPKEPPTELWSTMRMKRLGSIVVIQPFHNNAVAGAALTCDLETGTLSISDVPAIESEYTTVYGVLGLLKVDAGPALVVITSIEQAATLRNKPLYKITATQVLTDKRSRKWTSADNTFLDLLQAGVDPKKYGSSLYFSYSGDATLRQQKYEAAVADPSYNSTTAWKRAEPAFIWNQALAAPLLDVVGASIFVPVVFMGFATTLPTFQLPTPSGIRPLTVTLIARRSNRRAGCRQWRRGADPDSNVANYVESEQIAQIGDSSDSSSSSSTSFVQVRGSIPILWSQAPNLKYKIPIKIAPVEASGSVLAAHNRFLERFYGSVTAINLANETGREGKLSAAYKAAVGTLAADAQFRLVPFDFHKHCGATNYKNLDLLWQEIAPDFEKYGYWVGQGGQSTVKKQQGVFRTNCVDTLDRTNVVQGLLARKQLEDVLRSGGFMGKDDTLVSALPELEKAFRVLWADHGDEISRQYAGTGAMKSAFTRTGKRDTAGLLDDGVKSLTRYFLNNFHDGHKQDSLDLVTGNYKIGYGKSKPFQPQATPLIPLLIVAACIAFAVYNARQLSAAGGLFVDPLMLLYQVVLLYVLAAGVVVYMFKNGRRFVDTPQLRPDMTQSWTTASSVSLQ